MPTDEAHATTTSPARERVEAECEALRREIDEPPTVAVFTDTAREGVAERLTDARRGPFGTSRPSPREGGAGEWVTGTLEGTSVAVMPARRLADGFSPQEVIFPVRVWAALGVEAFVLLGRGAPLDPDGPAEGLMVVTDHLNLQGVNPLAGANEDDWGPRFPDMTTPYDADWRAAVEQHLGEPCQQGVWAAVPGPEPSTPAEQRMLRTVGADAVGFGLVPEVLAARHMGRRVLAAAHFAAEDGEEAAGEFLRSAVACLPGG